MNGKQAKTDAILQPKDIPSAQELRAIGEEIRDSGVLGRSRVYASLLDYLINCSIEGKIPKEIEIAVDVLGRQGDFDVSQDSSVRVYIHQLRKKLRNFYAAQQKPAPFRIIIPKGQYTIAAVAAAGKADSQPAKKPWAGVSLSNALLLTLSLLLLMNLWVLSRDDQSSQEVPGASAAHPLWKEILDDDMPILLVMGDYYIFGELSNNGDIARMVREFNINSPGELENWQFSDVEIMQKYLDLDLSYLPEGSAYALARIVPVLASSGKYIDITMMSDLSLIDIRSNHIVYIGYISALGKLSDIAFTGSGLRLGRSYDELRNLETDEYYTSDAGLPGQQFRDYGLFSSFPASNETQLVLVAGMRDAGLMQTAQSVSEYFTELEILSRAEAADAVSPLSVEALFEVFGMGRMNFNSKLIYTSKLDSSLIWNGNLTSYVN
jgi:hypothetical protein